MSNNVTVCSNPMTSSQMMNLPNFDQLEQIAREDTAIRPREHKGYSVYRIGDQYTYKRFHFPLDQLPDEEGDWSLESRILTAAYGVPGVPVSYGYNCHRIGDELVVHYLREYIDGELIQQVTKELGYQMADFFAQLHSRLVTTNDAHLLNFIVTSEGKLYFIDFGKASQFNRRDFSFYLKVGRELTKAKQSIDDYNPKNWPGFLARYYQGSRYSSGERTLMKLVLGALSLREGYRTRRTARKKKNRA